VFAELRARPAGTVAAPGGARTFSLPPGNSAAVDRPALHRHVPPEAHPFFRELARRAPFRACAGAARWRARQYVPFGERAWHAGASQYRGRSTCMNFSVGLELEGTDDTPYTRGAYQQLAALAAAFLAAYASLPLSTSSATATRAGAARPIRERRF